MKRISLISLLATIVIIGSTIGSAAIADAKQVTLYKNPQCGCCEEYAKYLRENGFSVTVKPTHQLVAMSREAGLPDKFQGCHLAQIDGYFVSGHVPVASVNRLLAERPDIRGITLPNMPQGSPGMSGTKTEPFTIFAIGDVQPQVYAVD